MGNTHRPDKRATDALIAAGMETPLVDHLRGVLTAPDFAEVIAGARVAIHATTIAATSTRLQGLALVVAVEIINAAIESAAANGLEPLPTKES